MDKAAPDNLEASTRYIGLEHIEKHTGSLLGHGTSDEVRSTKSRFREGELLYGKLRPYLNKVHVAEFDGICSTDILVLRALGGVHAKYLHYRLLSKDFVRYANKNVSGVQHPRVNARTVSLFDVELPPLNEQRRIVEKIEELFTKLDAGVRSLEQLKGYRRSVLKAAVEGELSREWRETHRGELEPASELLERILQERREKFAGKKYREPASPDTSELPALSDEWEWATVDQLTNVGTGATPLKSNRAYYRGGSIPWVTSGALNDLFIRDCDQTITEVALKETNAKLFPKHTLLVAMYGEGKTRGKVSELLIEAATNQACAALTFSNLSKDCRSYVKLFLQKNYDDIRRLSAGGVQPNLNLSIVKSTAISLPPLEEQRFIVEEVERRLSVVDKLEATVEARRRTAPVHTQAGLLRRVGPAEPGRRTGERVA